MALDTPDGFPDVSLVSDFKYIEWDPLLEVDIWPFPVCEEGQVFDLGVFFSLQKESTDKVKINGVDFLDHLRRRRIPSPGADISVDVYVPNKKVSLGPKQTNAQGKASFTCYAPTTGVTTKIPFVLIITAKYQYTNKGKTHSAKKIVARGGWSRLIRENVDTGRRILLRTYCSKGGYWYRDECVPPGRYRYGFDIPLDCESDYYGTIDVSKELGNCKKSPDNPGYEEFTGDPPWAGEGQIRYCDGCSVCTAGNRSMRAAYCSVLVLLIMTRRRRSRQK